MSKVSQIIDEYEKGFWSWDEFKREFIKEIRTKNFQRTLNQLNKLNEIINESNNHSKSRQIPALQE
jgi:pterin-4a-carbinolamine dehydratase